MAKDFVQMDLLSWKLETEPNAAVIEATEPVTESFNDEMRRKIAERDGVSPDCKHLSIWNKTVCSGDCHDCESCTEFTDGITADRLEDIEIILPKKMGGWIKISLSCGDSGNWYMGYSINMHVISEGMSFAAFPKFSKEYPDKYSAFKDSMSCILAWLDSRKVKKESIKAIKAELQKHIRGIDPEQSHRDAICPEWRECGYLKQCFSPENELGDTVCFKDQHTQSAKKESEKSLVELCAACKSAHPFCKKCCSACSDKCTCEQRCRWPEVFNK